jgi:hypothetical protein
MEDVRFIKRLRSAPKVKTQIHALAAPGASAKALAEFARSFGIESKRAVKAEDPAKFTYTAGQHVLSLFKASGALRYQDQTRWQSDDGKSNMEISDAEAQKLALAVIKKDKLAPPNELRLLKVTRLMAGVASVETKRGTERVLDVGVAFQRRVGGVPVDGPGGKLIVYLDHEGELTGFDRIWRPTRAVQAQVKELRHPKLAEEDLRRYWRTHGEGHIDVHEVRFGYFELGYQDSQRVLQPAYVMPLTLVSRDERIVMRSVHVFPAATNAVGKFMPPPKKVVPQPERKN